MTQTTAQQDAPTDDEKPVSKWTGSYKSVNGVEPTAKEIVAFTEGFMDAISRYAPAQDAGQERDAAVRNAGSTLSNIAFNMAQQVGKVLDSDDVSMLDSARLAWDRALKSTSAGEGE